MYKNKSKKHKLTDLWYASNVPSLPDDFNSNYHQIESGSYLNLISDQNLINRSSIINLWENKILVILVGANVSVNKVFENHQSFQNINLKSKIYAITMGEQLQMFEVYRKKPAANLTVDLVCRINQKGNKIEYLNRNEIWTRRKNLSGVHFRIGYVPNDNFFLKINEVRKGSWYFTKHNHNLKLIFCRMYAEGATILSKY